MTNKNVANQMPLLFQRAVVGGDGDEGHASARAPQEVATRQQPEKMNFPPAHPVMAVSFRDSVDEEEAERSRADAAGSRSGCGASASGVSRRRLRRAAEAAPSRDGGGWVARRIRRDRTPDAGTSGSSVSCGADCGVLQRREEASGVAVASLGRGRR